MGETLFAKIKEKGLFDRSSISNLIKNSDLNTKFAALATTAELKPQQDKIVKLQAFDSQNLFVKSILKMMAHLIFEPVHRCFKEVANSNYISV